MTTDDLLFEINYLLVKIDADLDPRVFVSHKALAAEKNSSYAYKEKIILVHWLFKELNRTKTLTPTHCQHVFDLISLQIHIPTLHHIYQTMQKFYAQHALAYTLVWAILHKNDCATKTIMLRIFQSNPLQQIGLDDLITILFSWHEKKLLNIANLNELIKLINSNLLNASLNRILIELKKLQPAEPESKRTDHPDFFISTAQNQDELDLFFASSNQFLDKHYEPDMAHDLFRPIMPAPLYSYNARCEKESAAALVDEIEQSMLHVLLPDMKKRIEQQLYFIQKTLENAQLLTKEIEGDINHQTLKIRTLTQLQPLHDWLNYLTFFRASLYRCPKKLSPALYRSLLLSVQYLPKIDKALFFVVHDCIKQFYADSALYLTYITEILKNYHIANRANLMNLFTNEKILLNADFAETLFIDLHNLHKYNLVNPKNFNALLAIIDHSSLENFQLNDTQKKLDTYFANANTTLSQVGLFGPLSKTAVSPAIQNKAPFLTAVVMNPLDPKLPKMSLLDRLNNKK